ncbi:MAG TPA: pyridoxal-phosphate dependent enzyme [Chitinophagales bacterium]|nr:pyridoxal-phosphate dependent enzyme [Chitinophagales bacterium]
MQKLLEILQLPSPLQKVEYSDWNNNGIEVYFKRDDLIHPSISGNKWRKLYGHLQKYKQGNFCGILTFGGAFSNHIIAVAAACNILNIPCIGIIRGEIDVNNSALKYASEQNMQLLPLSRSAYRNKDISSLQKTHPELDLDGYMIVPEGGAEVEGLIGCQSIIDEIGIPYDEIVLACGTGTTLAGILKHTSNEIRLTGISVLKGKDTLTEEIGRITSLSDNFQILTDYHCGGYAKINEELLNFAKDFSAQTLIPLDYVYTAKMVFAFDDLLKNNYFKPNSKIILLHTGGLMNARIG